MTRRKARHKTRHRIIWCGIRIEINYDPAWMSANNPAETVAHLRIRSVRPQGAKLPVTETGYRSHHTSAAEIDAAGGPVAFVRGWLEATKGASDWAQFELFG
jgi:hypothetical protein